MLICSNDPDQRLKALQYLAYVCEEYGFFYLVNHGVPDCVIERALNGISDFFDLTEEEKKDYEKKNSTDRIRWGLGFSPGDHEAVKREYLKVLPHPKFEGPAKPAGFRYKKIVFLKKRKNRVCTTHASTYSPNQPKILNFLFNLKKCFSFLL
ncbi:unnamed protein product [Prunus armeniaca]